MQGVRSHSVHSVLEKSVQSGENVCGFVRIFFAENGIAKLGPKLTLLWKYINAGACVKTQLSRGGHAAAPGVHHPLPGDELLLHELADHGRPADLLHGARVLRGLPRWDPRWC